MNYGFLIRNDRCIGCHACSTACKSENEVPLGVNRTWVKSVEKGAYPNVRRHFQVTRCNHCANPPCVRICPVTAMYQRDDGIVEFDPDVCIGCKACMQACPYDAIYVDPDTGTAAKCHYCAHRVEVNLEPACVVVCPEHAIIAGDMDDPSSEISRMLAEHQAAVRKPEQGTSPKLFYVDGEETNLTPTAVDRTPETFAWADVLPLHEGERVGGAQAETGPARNDDRHAGDGALHPPASHEVVAGDADDSSESRRQRKRRSASGTQLRPSQPQGAPAAGPVMIGEGRMAGQMMQPVYNAQHKIPWHWPVPAYLVTKAVGSGLFLLMAVGYGLGLFALDLPQRVVIGLASLLFMTITTALLVYDLERPERFLRILLRPQWKSWLTRGAFLLVAFTTVAAAWWIAEAGAWLQVWPALGEDVRLAFLWAGVPLAVGAAVYTAFLFGQAEGRDLWQSTLLPLHLVVQALMMGSGAFLVLHSVTPFADPLPAAVRLTFGVTVAVDLLVMMWGEFGMPHASETAARAAKAITHGRYRRLYWSSIAIGHIAPLMLMVLDGSAAGAVAALLAAVGLYAYEYAFVMAPQEIPNS